MSQRTQSTRDFATQTATIAQDATTSDIVQISEYDRGSIKFPSAFTGATVTFQGAESRSGTFVTIRDASAAVSVTVTASAGIPIPDAVFHYHSIRIVSASSEAAARSLIVCLK